MSAVGLDSDRLASCLATAVPGFSGPITLERISGGQSNPTFFVTSPSHRLVLRKQPDGDLLPSAHAIDREFKVISALTTTGVPVPPTLFYEADRAVIGTPFYVMQRLDGRVFHDCTLPGLTPPERGAAYRSMAETLAKLHSVVPDAVGLSDFGRRGGYFERQIRRWSQQWQTQRTREDAHIEHLIGWLPANIPADDAHGIVHGDYRLGNLMLHAEDPQVIAILDWELSTLGHPLADLAHCCMAWESAPDEYGGIEGLDLDALGIPPRDVFEAAYYAHASHGLRLAPFHRAFALFRWSLIFEGIAARARAGTANDANAGQTGRLAAVFAKKAAAYA